MKFTSSVLLSSLASLTQATDVYSSWIGTNGGDLECPDYGQIMTGMCTAGCSIPETGFENTYAATAQCALAPTADGLEWVDTTSTPTTVTTEWGSYATCPPNTVVTARGAGEPPTDQPSITCTPIKTPNVMLNYTDTVVMCGDWNVFMTCPPGYAITKACAGYNFEGDDLKYSCGNDICSDYQNLVSTGIQCTAIGAYEFDTVVSHEANATAADFVVQDCKINTLGSMTKVSHYTVDRTITGETSVETTTTKSYEGKTGQSTGTSLTKTLDTSYSISAQVGLPSCRVKGTWSTSSGSSHTKSSLLETSFSTSQQYLDQMYYGHSKQESTSVELALARHQPWAVLSWGAQVMASGDYVVQYNKYIPGAVNSTSVIEDVTIGTTDLDDRFYVVALSGRDYPQEYLQNTACETIALQYMMEMGPFANKTTVSTDSRRYLRSG